MLPAATTRVGPCAAMRYTGNLPAMTEPILRDYQQEVEQRIYAAWHASARNVILVLPTGAGKCLGKGTPILMWDGTIQPVETVRMGDLLMGPDSTPRLVLGTTRGSEMLYRITPTKGDPYVVNESHILSLRMTETDELVNLSVRDYLTKSKTFKHCAKGWRTGVEWLHINDLPLDPYFLGLWLGDGDSKGAAICTGEPETEQWLAAYAESLGMTLRIEHNSTNSNMVHLISTDEATRGRGYRPNIVLNKLRQLGLLHDKHIPHEYKTANTEMRMQVLAGLLDTDSHMSHNGFDVVLKSEQLFDDVLFLARSLGFAAYKTACKKTCANNGVTGDYFRMHISGDTDRIPNRIPRRKCSPRTQRKNHLRTGITVEPIGVGDYYGFEISGDRLFMLGDFTVTHNTVTFANIMRRMTAPSIAIAHRQELVSQISLALARYNVRHRIIGSAATIQSCVQLHGIELGTSYYNATAPVAVASVDTLIRRDASDPLFRQTRLWVCDEAHHLLVGNKWGKAVEMFPNAFGLGVTATACRADGKGLGRHHDGVMDVMIVGPSMRDLIHGGYLTEYRVFAPPNDLDMTDVTVTAGGDYSPEPLRKAVRRSHIHGDVVAHYMRIAAGKLGVTFAVDVESAVELADAYRQQGIPAEAISAGTPDNIRYKLLRMFANGELKQLVNVDLFGEGFDLPAIEVCSMARPTQSYGLFVQQFGRALRPMDGKTHATIIDHAGNTLLHGLPDAPRDWTLDRRERRSKTAPGDGPLPLRSCLNCAGVYERSKTVCPYCGTVVVPSGRGSPDVVDGDLSELTPDVLARMRGEIAVSDTLRIPYGAAPEVAGAIRRNHRERMEAQQVLRERMMLWGGARTARGVSIAEAQREFYLRYGCDVAAAQLLNRADALALTERIKL